MVPSMVSINVQLMPIGSIILQWTVAIQERGALISGASITIRYLRPQRLNRLNSQLVRSFRRFIHSLR